MCGSCRQAAAVGMELKQKAASRLAIGYQKPNPESQLGSTHLADALMVPLRVGPQLLSTLISSK